MRHAADTQGMLAVGTSVLQAAQSQAHHVNEASYARSLHDARNHLGNGSAVVYNSPHEASVAVSATTTTRPHAPPDTPASHPVFRRNSGTCTMLCQQPRQNTQIAVDEDDADKSAATTRRTTAPCMTRVVHDTVRSVVSAGGYNNTSNSSSSGSSSSQLLRLDTWLTPLQQRRHRGLPHRRAQAKLLELTFYWLALPETQTRLDALVHDTLAAASSATSSAARDDVASTTSPTAQTRGNNKDSKSSTPRKQRLQHDDVHDAAAQDNGQTVPMCHDAHTPRAVMHRDDDNATRVHGVQHTDSDNDEATMAAAAVSRAPNTRESSSASASAGCGGSSGSNSSSSSSSSGGGGVSSNGGESNSDGSECCNNNNGNGNGNAATVTHSVVAATTSVTCVVEADEAAAAQDSDVVVVHGNGEAKLCSSSSSSKSNNSDSGADGSGDVAVAVSGAPEALLRTSSSSSPSGSSSSLLSSLLVRTRSPQQSITTATTSPTATANATMTSSTRTTATTTTTTAAAVVAATDATAGAAAAVTTVRRRERDSCSYDDIPRFYFPLGKPTTRTRVISGPVRPICVNPHLVLPEGATVATSAAAVYDAGERGGAMPRSASNKSNNSSSSSIMKDVADKSTTSTTTTAAAAGGAASSAAAAAAAATTQLPMSTLRCVDDRHVMHYVQKEFARHSVFGKMQKHTSQMVQQQQQQQQQQQRSSALRLLGGGAGGGRGRSAASLARLEASYRTHLVQCMQRLCTQTFGVPRYLAYLLVNIVQAHAAQQAAASSSTTSNSSSSNSSSSITGRHAPVITPQHVYEVYEAHLKNKDSMRRTFDLLILSSSVTSTQPQQPPQQQAQQHNHAGKATSGNNNGSSATALTATPLRPHLVPSDFLGYLHALVQHHPGLAFLKQTPTFQERYVETVIYRVFYDLDRLDRGTIRFTEFALSPVLDAMRQVDACDDINAVLRYFSYEHFYVLYCKFWELDTDRDMLLAPADLLRYVPDEAMNPRVVQRVFVGAARPLRCAVPGCIGYEDFVYFCLSEEDKSTPRALRYWFKLLDLDGDGVLSLHELQHFYDATRDIMLRYLSSDAVASFAEVVRQVYDMMRTPAYRALTLPDLLAARESACVALNMLTSVVRFWQYEQRDPFVAHTERLLGAVEQTAWDRFARAEYDRMAQEAEE